MNRWAQAAGVCLLVAQPHIAAINVALTQDDVRRALGIAAGPLDVRVRFHAPYIRSVDDPAIERLEVITEFRRLVLASEEQASLGNWMVARGGYDRKGRTLADMLQRWKGQVSIKIRFRFHPHNSYAAVPLIDTLVGEPSYLPLDVTRTPLLAGVPKGQRAPLTGAVVETTFNAPSFSDRAQTVRIVLDGKELVRTTVDFTTLE